MAVSLVVSGIDFAFAAEGETPVAQQSSKSRKGSSGKSGSKSGSRKKSSSKSGTKQSTLTGKKGKKGSTSGKNSGKNSGKGKTKESAADLKRRQENAQKEIKKTQEELRRNEAEVKKGLSELSRLEGDIQVSQKETSALSAEVKKLDGTITTLNGKIAANTAELDRMRSEYLKAVKKMRTSRKSNSTLAYVFGAKNLAQAERRMRYLKQFSEWKDTQTKEINAKVASLKRQQNELKRAKSDKDVMLGRELKAQARLTEQRRQQDAVVVALRANGEALQSHLSKKQAEVNQLRNQVAALIAEEQRKAEAERREAERREAERIRREEAEARRLAEEKAAAERKEREEAERLAMNKEKSDKEISKAEKKAEKERNKKEKAAREAAQKEAMKKEAARKEMAKKERGKKDGASKDYASARKRRPRGGDAASTGGTASKATPSAASSKNRAVAGDFAKMKGALPRPVSGAFRITSPFGKHALPDLPDVTYDNPGIDAETAAGASAQAVYAGTVSGVYLIPGFSTVVIVNHGDYYTVYGNIASASVKVGDKVAQGQKVGALASDPDSPGHSTIHFEVWKGREKLNPTAWIK